MHRESKKKRKFLFNAFLCLNFYSFCNINDIYNGSIHRRVKHKAVINRNNDLNKVIKQDLIRIIGYDLN